MTPRILITGPSGFVGGAVVRAAIRSVHRPLLRLVLHHRPITALTDGRCHVVEADLADAASIYGLCEGMDLVLHCASRIGADPEQCAATNARGTRALVAEAERAGVRRLVYLSTASVYGRGVFVRAREENLGHAPVSPASRTRAEAELAVLAHGGTVLRPHLVYGVGDRWVVPGLAALLRTLDAPAGRWPTRVSMVDVGSLAQVLLAAAFSDRPRLAGAAYHANHPDPVDCAVLLEHVRALLGARPPAEPVDLTRAAARVAADPRSRHVLAMLSTDHWFESSRIWNLTGCPPGPGFPGPFQECAPWYRALLGAADDDFTTPPPGPRPGAAA